MGGMRVAAPVRHMLCINIMRTKQELGICRQYLLSGSPAAPSASAAREAVNSYPNSYFCSSSI